MKKFILIFFFLSSSLILSEEKLIFIGDSITWGQLGDVPNSTLIPSDESYASLIEQELAITHPNIKTYNFAKSGSTSADWAKLGSPALANLIEQVKEQLPSDTVHILLGTNDSAFKISPQDFRNNILTIIHEIQKLSPNSHIYLSKPPLRPLPKKLSLKIKKSSPELWLYIRSIQASNEFIKSYWSEIDFLVQKVDKIFPGIDFQKIISPDDYTEIDIHPNKSAHKKSCAYLLNLLY